MPRIARIVAIDYPHHVTQRGNFCQNIFDNEKDRQNYLGWIEDYSDRYKLSILSYCLMNNHVHFIVVPRKEDSLARTFNTAHMRYAQYANKKMRRNGHLWQGRFFSCVLDEGHLIMAARYIERNPVRAKLAAKPWSWQWSTAKTHIGLAKPLIKMDNLFDFIDMEPNGWQRYIEEEDSVSMVNSIRKHTQVGRPLGESQFIERLSDKLGVRFPVLTRGRPKKES